MPKMISKALCISPLLLISSLSFADCDRNMNQTDLNICTAQEYKQADQKLNKLYKSYTAKLTSAQRKQFIDIQKTWVNYKNKDCRYTAQAYEGGSMYPLVLNDCLTEKTEDRIEDLEDYLQDTKR